MNPNQRPSIRDILSSDDLRTEAGRAGMSEQDVVDLLVPIAGLPSNLFHLFMKIGEGVGKAVGLKSCEQDEKAFSCPYSLVVRATAWALSSLGHEIKALCDTPQGSAIQARLPIDIFSLGGSLLCVIEEGRSEVRIMGFSEIEGQMLDWGKGKRALREVFDKIERYVNLLPPPQELDVARSL